LLESAPGVFNGLTSDLKNNSFQKDYFKAIWSAEKYALITIIGVLCQPLTNLPNWLVSG